MVKTKKEFIMKVQSMKRPYMFEFEEDSMFKNLSFICKDLDNSFNRFETNTIRFNPENQMLEDYNIRVEKYKQKINKWFNEAKNQ